MQRLNRPDPPTCLSDYQHGKHHWDDVPVEEKGILRKALAEMQNHRCAYCEAKLKFWHIEHFYTRHQYPQKTFDWDNLFGSCTSEEHCGDYKDKKGKPYQPADLIHPCQHSPDEFLFFAQDGTVRPRHGLSAAHRKRAEETIRVFNLDAPDLRKRRAQVIRDFEPIIQDIINFLSSLDDDERPLWIADFLQEYAIDAHPTPIRHLLTIPAQNANLNA